MNKFTLVPVSPDWVRSPNPVAAIESRTRLLIAGYESVGSINREVIERMKSIEPGRIVVVLNDYSLKRQPTPFSERMFSFCGITRCGSKLSFLGNKEAMKVENFVLLRMKKPVCFDAEPVPQRVSPACGMEFKCHLDLNAAFRKRTKDPAYVNLGRTEEQIGYSSWNGNLVSWFNSGFQSRIQFAVQAGLIPTED